MAVDPNLPFDQKKSLRKPGFGQGVFGDPFAPADPNAPAAPAAAPISAPGLRAFGDAVSQPGVGIAGAGTGGTPDQVAQQGVYADNLQRGLGQDPNNLLAGQPGAANQFAGVNGSAQTFADPAARGLRALAPGVTRYQLDPGNEAEVYATRGKDGSTVFTDNPAYAARVGNGQTLAGGTPEEAARIGGPNAGFAYKGPSIGGLRRQDISTLDDATTTKALDQILTNSTNDPETQAANAIDRNRLIARQQTLRRPATPNLTINSNGQAAGALTPENQIQLLRLQQQDARAAQANAISLQNGKNAADAAGRAADSSDRSAQAQTFSQLQSLRKTDPGSYATGLVSQLPQDPAELSKYLKSSQGQLVKNSLLQDVVQPGQDKSLYPIEWGDSKASKSGDIDFSKAVLDPQTGAFKGFTNDSGTDSPDYPAKTGVWGSNNYDPALSRITPAMWRILQQDGISSRKAR